MKKNPYDVPLTKGHADATDAVVDKVQFSLKKTKPAATTAKPAFSKAQTEQLLRANVKMRKKRTPLPWKAVAGLAVSLFVAGYYVVSPSTFEKLLDKVEIRAMGAAEPADKPAADQKPADTPADKSQPAGAEGEKAASAKGATKASGEKTGAEEQLSQFEKLKQRKEELDAREKELTELEEELQRQKVELDKRITQLDEMRNQIARTLKDRVDVDQEKVTKLVDLYSNMKPKQAAEVIGSINEELAVEVLAKMKKKNAAEIMNLLSPEKARVLSEKYTGYRRISSQDPKG